MIGRPMSRGLPLMTAACLLALGGCASSPDVRVNYDRATDFGQFKTFGFADPLGTDRQGYQSIVSTFLKTAAQRELEARGMRFEKASPQLLVNFSAKLDEKVWIRSAPPPMAGMAGRPYYGYRTGMYGSWATYDDMTIATPYTEGTVNIDVVDAARKQLVWEGVVSGTVTQETRDNLQPAIDKAVAAAFEKYPVPGPAKSK